MTIIKAKIGTQPAVYFDFCGKAREISNGSRIEIRDRMSGSKKFEYVIVDSIRLIDRRKVYFCSKV